MSTLVKMGQQKRRGRLPQAEREQRQADVLQAANDELLERGYANVTMLDIARRADASKETLYSWFGSRDGLFAAMIEANADRSATAIGRALSGDTAPRETLVSFATGLLTLLTGSASVALNHAAMQSPELATLLLESGRHRIGPLVETYLAQLDEAGTLTIPDPAVAFTTLYGLVVSDQQIRVLLGEPPPNKRAVAKHAQMAVDQFMALYS